MITDIFDIETVTFLDNGFYPELSGYGREIPIIIQHHNEDDPEKTITVKIGDLVLLPEQINLILERIELYKQVLKAYN